MKPKALTVAIASAFAVPMAAQAVDFNISGHVSRALFIVDKEDSTRGQVANNGGSSSRVRVTGSNEMMDGNTVGIQVEWEEGSSMDENDDKKTDTILKLRHANVQYTGDFGRVTIGQGSEAGDGSAYSDTTGVFGIGHGAGTSSDFSLGSYFGSLDAGGRVNMIRYDAPDIGPIGVAVSVGNDNRVSGMVKLNTEFGGTSFGAKVASLQEEDDKSTFGASFGATMASGFTVSGAWAVGESMGGTDPTYFQTEIGYKFGDTGVAVSWYSGEDFVNEGSESTAIGIGAIHTLPKVGAEVYVAAQNYDVGMADGMDTDETVLVIGTRVKF